MRPLMQYWLLPEAEQPAAKVIARLIDKTESLTNQFEDTVLLLNFLEERQSPKLPSQIRSNQDLETFRRWGEWKQIAFRSAAITLGNYVETKRVVRHHLEKAPSIADRVDNAALEKARELFDDAFPGIDGVRTTFAHSADIKSRTPNEHTLGASKIGDAALNGLRIAGGESLTLNVTNGATFSTTLKGGGQLSLTDASVRALQEATAEYLRGYDPVLEYTFCLWCEAKGVPPERRDVFRRPF